MDKKFYLIFGFMVLALIFSISFVSASDDISCSNHFNSSLDLEHSVSIEENINNGLFESEANEISSNSNMKNLNSSTATLGNSHTVPSSSFSNIQNAINDAKEGDTLILSGNYYDNKKQIRINKDKITIKGKSASNKAVLDAKDGQTRIFYITGDNVRLENLIFKNANADTFGGAITATGSHLTILNCEFINNKAQVGAIVLSNKSDYAVIRNCIFKNNGGIYTKNNNGGWGGAIDSHGSHGQIVNCTFASNYAVNGGGSVYMKKGRNNTIKDCTFNNNTAPVGGAFALSPNYHDARVLNCRFHNNTAETNGGAIFVCNYTKITNCIFQDNHAGNNGGAVNGRYYINIQNSNFTNNSAGNYGGGAYFQTSKNHNLTGSTFIENTAKYGGAVATGPLAKDLNIKSSTFKNNHADENGGALYLKGITQINSCIFSANLANYIGGSLFILNKTNIHFSNFTSNIANVSAGAICINSSNNLIDSCKFLNNFATSASALSYEKNHKNLVLKYSYFDDNLALNNGILCLNSETKVVGCSFNNNIVDGPVGTIFSNSTVIISESNFTNNTAYYGGAIYNIKKLNIEKSIFRFNSAFNGSAIYNNRSCNVSHCVFEDNQAKSYILNVKDYHIGKGDKVKLIAYLEYGDTCFGIYNNRGILFVDDNASVICSGAPKQEILLKINNKNYTSITNDSGFAIFILDTSNFVKGNYSMIICHLESSIATSIFNRTLLEISEKLEKDMDNTDGKQNINENSNKNNILTSRSNKNKGEEGGIGENSIGIKFSSSNSPISGSSRSVNIRNVNGWDDLKNLVDGSSHLNGTLYNISNWGSDFYIKFPFANNRSDSDLLFVSYVFKEISYKLLDNPNFPIFGLYTLSLGLDFYIVGSFTEAYVLCNGSVLGFFNYPFFHDPKYSDFMESTFGNNSPWVKGIVDFGIGVDSNGDMSIGQFLINILSLVGIGIWGKIGTKIINKLDKFRLFLEGSKIGILIPNRIPNLNTIFNLVDDSIQLVNKPHTGLVYLAYDVGKFLGEKFGFSYISRGSESGIISSIVNYFPYVDMYLNNLGKSIYNILTTDYRKLPSKLSNLFEVLSKSASSEKREGILSKGNQAIYNENKKIQVNFIKKVSKKVSKTIPMKIKKIIKKGAKELSKHLGLSNKNKKTNRKKLKTISKTGKDISKKVSTKIKRETTKNKSKPKMNKNKKTDHINKTAKKISIKVRNNLKSKNNKTINKITNYSEKLIKRTLSFFK